MSAKTFREAFCERFQIRPEDYPERLLWRCHHRRALPLGRLIWRRDPHFYDMDMELIRSVADCTTLSDVRMELNDFLYHNQAHGFWRRFLHVRLSGQRLVNLAAKLLG